jgi:hypothetical protein
MTNRFTILLAAPLILAAPRPALAFASPSTIFDTVDGVTIFQGSVCSSGIGCFTHTFIDVTGIRKGQTTVSTVEFDFGDQAPVAAHCQRLATVAMAKPGKYRFGIGADINFNSVNHGNGACNLTIVAP